MPHRATEPSHLYWQWRWVQPGMREREKKKRGREQKVPSLVESDALEVSLRATPSPEPCRGRPALWSPVTQTPKLNSQSHQTRCRHQSDEPVAPRLSLTLMGAPTGASARRPADHTSPPQGPRCAPDFPVTQLPRCGMELSPSTSVYRSLNPRPDTEQGAGTHSECARLHLLETQDPQTGEPKSTGDMGATEGEEAGNAHTDRSPWPGPQQ
nr:uncharacterized protein LOC123478161 [Desmodus rotundus]